MYVYINGEIVHQSKAVISPFDHGYMYGLGVFETFRVYNNHPFLFHDHLTRLNQSVKELNINWEETPESIRTILHDLLKVNNLSNAYVRLNVSAGAGEIGLQTDAYDQPSTIVYIKPISNMPTPLVKEGVVLRTRRNSPEGDRRLKSHHYLNNILAKRELGADMGKEGIFLTKEGYLAEGIVSNLFFVKNQVVYTPALETGILDGITRAFVLSALDKKGIRVEQGLFSLDDLLTSDEVFMTNSIQEIFTIRNIGEYEFKTGEGTLTYTLQRLYQRLTSSLWSRDEL